MREEDVIQICGFEKILNKEQIGIKTRGSEIIDKIYVVVDHWVDKDGNRIDEDELFSGISFFLRYIYPNKKKIK